MLELRRRRLARSRVCRHLKRRLCAPSARGPVPVKQRRRRRARGLLSEALQVVSSQPLEMDESFAGCFLRVKSGLGGVIWPLLLLRLCSQMTRTVASTMPPAWHCGLAPARTAPPNSSRHAICDRSTRRHADCLSYGYTKLERSQKDPASARAHARSTSRVHGFAARCTALHVAEGVKKPARRAGESSKSAKLWS